jgi:ribosome biogenesis GTPase
MTRARAGGTVVESFGRRIAVALEDGRRVDSKLRGRKLDVVVGDVVALEGDDATDDWSAVERRPRRNLFSRSNSRGNAEALAANLDQLAVVVAPRPACDLFIVDRYLAGARYAGITSILIANKCDLPRSVEDEAALSAYRTAGVPQHDVSARSRHGMETLQQLLAGRRTLLAGQSGVGKSTLFNELSGGAFRATRTLSTATQEGRHTTVSSAIVFCPWGELVDSPGVRDYAPPLVPLRDVQRGFAEIEAAALECRFQDCLHAREPECAVRRAVETSQIDGRRYESYRRLLNLTRQLEERRGHRS